MKVGILTFHSQLNYGGVLQCWALQTALENCGFEVVIIDRWFDKHNTALECGFNKPSLKLLLKFARRHLFGESDYKKIIRISRTKRFIRRYLHLQNFHFVNWPDAPKQLDVDVVVVGSDQVWHSGDFGDPRPYLLEGAPAVKAISYAASFGMSRLPDVLLQGQENQIDVKAVYRKGLAKFSALSCREVQGCEICKELGFYAEHVLDPTLLVDSKNWELFVKRDSSHKKSLVCYFLSEDVVAASDELINFAKKNNCRVIVFLKDILKVPRPTSVAKWHMWKKIMRLKFSVSVRLFESAGPAEFVSAFANSDYVLSDSFHALMFSCIFNKNVRILKPKAIQRMDMFSRITEIAANMKGGLISDSVSAALQSFMNGETVALSKEWLNVSRKTSLQFLLSNLK